MAITDLLNAIFDQNIDCKIEWPALNKLFKDILLEREIKILELRFGLSQ